jgi:fructose/tagatose bisphosphate aldolase
VALYNKAGVKYADANAEAVALANCNQFSFFKQVMDAAAAPNRDGFLATSNKLGHGWQSTSALGSSFFDANHHDGIAFYRNWAFTPSCTCMQYTGANLPAG